MTRPIRVTTHQPNGFTRVRCDRILGGEMARTAITLHQGDLPSGVDFGAAVAVDSETLGLKPHRDRLCVVQLSAGDGTAHLVQFDGSDYSAPNLKALLANQNVLKISFEDAKKTAKGN